MSFNEAKQKCKREWRERRLGATKKMKTMEERMAEGGMRKRERVEEQNKSKKEGEKSKRGTRE